MNKPILSIIVPSFNTFNYIDKCLPSFICTSAIGKYKVLLVDDGSTDGKTSKKLQEYCKKYPEIFSYYYKKNGGHGSVINYAVHNLIDTPYFRVVDGDDEIVTENLSEFIDFIYKNQKDVCFTDYVTNFISNKKQIKTCAKISDSSNVYESFLIVLPTITFKTDLFTKNNILVREHIYYEDTEYDIYPFEYVDNYVYYPKPIYIINSGNDSQSTTIENYRKHYNDQYCILLDFCNFYKKISKQKEKEQLAYFLKKCTARALRLNIVIFYDKNEISKNNKKEIKKKLIEIYKIVKSEFDFNNISYKELAKISILMAIRKFIKIKAK